MVVLISGIKQSDSVIHSGGLVTKSCLTLSNPMDCSPPEILSMEFSRQKYCSRLPFPSQGDLPNPRIEPASLVSPASAGSFLVKET